MKCSQLGGEMPLPNDEDELKKIFVNYNIILFESVCNNRSWIPIRRSKKNASSWESLSGNKVSFKN
jgi:hypothetical protein